MLGADINAQTDETQETALTLACCGGFLEVADFLIKAVADIELGCSTPLMEASQEGHLELVKYLLKAGMSSSIAVVRSGDADGAELHLLATGRKSHRIAYKSSASHPHLSLLDPLLHFPRISARFTPAVS